MILKNKNAVIYGAGGSLGSAVAKALAAAGATVYLTGRTVTTLEQVAAEIQKAGGFAKVEVVDAMDEGSVIQHLKKLKAGGVSIDISFNATGSDVVQDVPLVSMSVDDYMSPILLMTKTRFITAKAAGNIMMQQGSGVILSLTATPGGIGYPYTGGFSGACKTIENLCTNLAAELGIYGVRVVNMRSGGSPDSAVFKQAVEQYPEVMEKVLGSMKADTMIRKLPMMQDIANLAVFLCSDLAQLITGVTIDITGGTTQALNYRASKEKKSPGDSSSQLTLA